MTDEQIEAQIKYCARATAGRCRSSTPTTRIRATRYWELWGLPLFDTKEEDSENILREVRAAREAFPEHYIKLIAYDPTYTRQTTALAFIVNRPTVEKPFKLDRIQGPGRVNRFRLVPVEATRDACADGSANGAAEAAHELRVRHEAAPGFDHLRRREPEEYDVDEEEADRPSVSDERRPAGRASRRRTSSRCSTSSTAS